LTHFFKKLFFAAPASFRSVAEVSQVAVASRSHFFIKLPLAAPASFLSVAVTEQLGEAVAGCDAAG
jgi:hypothetical protein